MNPSADSEIVVQLLDASYGTALKSWRFQGRESISIGRDASQDVEVVDSYVSRTHAVLQRREGRWFLLSHGRNGVYVNNQAVNDLPITGDITFRLGASGPVLAFKLCAQKDENLATLCFDTAPIPLFAIDQTKLQQEVGAIADREDFLRLQEQARMLRRKKANQ